jgi:hypothetical protein
LIGSLWTRDADYGPDLIDFHDEMRDATSLDSARTMLDHITRAAEANDATLGSKAWFYSLGLAAFITSLFGTLPIVLFRP